MSERLWFIHLQGQILGPIESSTMRLMLEQNRLQFGDYVWHDKLSDWKRVYEIDEFEKLLPAFPKVPPPELQLKRAKASPPDEYFFKDTEPGAAELITGESFKIRRTARVRLAGTVNVKGRDPYKIVNISETGVFVMASPSLPIGTVLNLTLQAKPLGGPLELSGVVVRHHLPGESAGFAIEFTRMTREQRITLAEYVKTKRKA